MIVVAPMVSKGKRFEYQEGGQRTEDRVHDGGYLLRASQSAYRHQEQLTKRSGQADF